MADPRGVTLPRWCARVAVGATRPHRPEEARGRAGPFTLYGPPGDSEVFTWASGTRALIFDGYIVDRRALTLELDCEPGAANAALVAAAFDRWGADLFHHVDGCYLAAIWDAAADRVVLGHDGLGRHPAFYATADGAVWFGPNVLSLATCGAVPTAPNRMSLALLALRYWPEAGATFFDAIHRVRPGHYLSVRPSGDLREQKHWDPLPDEDEPWLPEAQVLEEFEPALTRAVGRCMELEPQGIMLSGGVDSVTIAALAMAYVRAHGLAPLVAVSGRSGGTQSHEEVMQSRVTEVLGMPHLVSTTPEWRAGRDHIQLSLDLTPELPSPSTVYWVGTYMGFYRHTAREHLHVLLTGSGGDNWLSVGDAYAADLLAAGRLGELVQFLRSDLVTGGSSLGSVVRRRVWAFGVRPHLDTWWARLAPDGKRRYHRARWRERLPSWLAPDRTLRDDLIERLLQRRTSPLAADGRAPRSYYRHALRSYSNPYMHHENETAFHVDALCGLRLLSPYHDRRLVSFFNRIAPRTLVHGNRYKGLLRPVVARHLSGLGLERQNKTYDPEDMAREHDAVRTSIAAVLMDYSFDMLAGLGIVDRQGLLREAKAIGTASLPAMARMYGMLSAERWLEARVS